MVSNFIGVTDKQTISLFFQTLRVGGLFAHKAGEVLIVMGAIFN